MTIDETVDILIRHSICIKYMHKCNRQCDTCSMSVKDQKILEAYETALDALAICGNMEPHQEHVEKVS